MRVADCMRCGTEATVLAGVCTPCQEKRNKQKAKELKVWWRAAEKALKTGERVMPPGWALEKRHTGSSSTPPSLWITVNGGHPLTGGYGFGDHSYECATEHAWGYYGIPLEVLLEICRTKFKTSRKAA